MPKDPNWKAAKNLLIEDIAAGFVTDDMDSMTVQALQQEYSICLPDNFKTNLKSLRDRIHCNISYSNRDKVALEHDHILFPKDKVCQSYPRWEGSLAEHFLKKDMDDGKHEKVKHHDFYMSRDEYQLFPSRVFNKHVHQESNARRGRSYWLHWNL